MAVQAAAAIAVQYKGDVLSRSLAQRLAYLAVQALLRVTVAFYYTLTLALTWLVAVELHKQLAFKSKASHCLKAELAAGVGVQQPLQLSPCQRVAHQKNVFAEKRLFPVCNWHPAVGLYVKGIGCVWLVMLNIIALR